MVQNFPTLSRENSSSRIQLRRVSQEAMQPNRLGTVNAWENQHLFLTTPVMTFVMSNPLAGTTLSSWTFWV